MLFNSYTFLLLFLPVALVGFYGLGRLSWKAGIYWLIGTSLAFYAWWNPDPAGGWTPFYLLLILASCAANFWCGKTIALTGSPGWKLNLLRIGVVGNLGLLLYYKYLGLFASFAQSVSGWPTEVPRLVLPLAVSFFTFLQIAFLVDAYRGKNKEYEFADYLLFVVFFPHLIAGPIVHHEELMPQFKPGRARFGWRCLAVGLTVLAIGLFKKVVIADAAADTATPLFELAASGSRVLTMGEAWAAALAYTVQIYFDFSGYSDMAIGIAYLFGIRLPLNFNSPYKATSIIDFWRRWHMTLSRFLRDYLYIPLGGNRLGPVRRYGNLLVTMLLGGMWHGAGWAFLIWGGLHGLFLCINHLWVNLRERHAWRPLPKLVAIMLTFLVVMMAWVPFRSGSFELKAGGTGAALKATGGIYSSLLGLHGWSGWPEHKVEIIKSSPAWRSVLIALAIAWALPNTQGFMGGYSPHYDAGLTARRRWWNWRPTWPWMLMILALFYAAANELDKVSEFIYFQF
jgi:D-alanyl-lipoteichoic acid acyltransferase DltB (MBOAT superfamily)